MKGKKQLPEEDRGRNPPGPGFFSGKGGDSSGPGETQGR